MTEYNDLFPSDKEKYSFLHPPEISSTPLSEVHTGTKRKHAATIEPPESEPIEVTSPTCQVHPLELDADLERELGEVYKRQEKEQDFFHLVWGYQSEECEPTAKRRPPEDVDVENESDTQKESNKAVFNRCTSTDEIQDIPETLLHWDTVQQDSNDQLHRSTIRQNRGVSSAFISAEDFPLEKRSQENLQACTVIDENVFSQGPVLAARPVTENRQTMKHPPKLELFNHNNHCSPVKRQNKENHRHISPKHITEVSPLKRLLSPSPVKRFPMLEKPKVKYYQSPEKSAKKSLENEQDSFAMLFTQDSEGFRVIAHRDQQTRHPLKDQTNSPESSESWNLPAKPLEMEEDSDLEPEMLFTQDSQGNIVIKH